MKIQTEQIRSELKTLSEYRVSFGGFAEEMRAGDGKAAELSVKCPYCGALPGVHCVYLSGAKPGADVRDGSHLSRRGLAKDLADFLELVMKHSCRRGYPGSWSRCASNLTPSVKGYVVAGTSCKACRVPVSRLCREIKGPLPVHFQRLTDWMEVWISPGVLAAVLGEADDGPLGWGGKPPELVEVPDKLQESFDHLRDVMRDDDALKRFIESMLSSTSEPEDVHLTGTDALVSIMAGSLDKYLMSRSAPCPPAVLKPGEVPTMETVRQAVMGCHDDLSELLSGLGGKSLLDAVYAKSILYAVHKVLGSVGESEAAVKEPTPMEPVMAKLHTYDGLDDDNAVCSVCGRERRNHTGAQGKRYCPQHLRWHHTRRRFEAGVYSNYCSICGKSYDKHIAVEGDKPMCPKEDE